MRLKKNKSNIANFATNTALTAVENKKPDHDKYITTPELGQQEKILLQE